MQKNVTKNVVMFVTMLVVIFNILPCKISNATTNSVTIALQQKTAYSGDIVNVNISCSQISSETKIGAYSYEITYDPTILEVINNEDVFLGEAASGSMCSVNFSEPGKIKVAGMTTSGISKTGVIGILSFKVITKNSGSTNINLNITKMITTEFDEIIYKIGTQGKITVLEEVVPEVEENITLSKSSITLNKGDSQTITASNSNVVWSTSNKSIATVINGKIIGVRAGTAKITATLGNSTATCTVTVEEVIIEDNITPQTDSSNNTSTESFDKNNEEIKEEEVEIEIEDEIQEEVENKVEIENQELIENEIKLESIKIKQETINFEIGEQYILEYILNPEINSDEYEIIWLSSNKDIATISDDGILTIHKEGNVTIRVYANNKICDTYEIKIVNQNNEGFIMGVILSLFIIGLLSMLAILVNINDNKIDFNKNNKVQEKIREIKIIKAVKLFKEKYKKISSNEPKLLKDKK